MRCSTHTHKTHSYPQTSVTCDSRTTQLCARAPSAWQSARFSHDSAPLQTTSTFCFGLLPVRAPRAGVLRLCVTWRIYIEDVTYYVARDSCGVRLVFTCQVTFSYACCDAFIRVMCHRHIHMGDMTYLYAGRDSYVSGAWLVCKCDVTCWHVWCDASMCVTGLVCMCAIITLVSMRNDDSSVCVAHFVRNTKCNTLQHIAT